MISNIDKSQPQSTLVNTTTTTSYVTTLLTEHEQTILHNLLYDITINTNNTLRFSMELEFIELLSNPYYIQYISQHRNKYLYNQSFITYIQYLQYWHTKPYCHYISHIYSLYALHILQYEHVRDILVNNTDNIIDLLQSQGYWHWFSFKYNRYKEYQDNKQHDTSLSSQQQQQQVNDTVINTGTTTAVSNT